MQAKDNILDRNNVILDILKGKFSNNESKENKVEEEQVVQDDVFKYIDMSNNVNNDNISKTLDSYNHYLFDYNSGDLNKLELEKNVQITPSIVLPPIEEKPKKFELFGTTDVAKKLVTNICAFLHISEYLTMSMVCSAWKKIILRITREMDSLVIVSYNQYTLKEEDTSIYNKSTSYVYPTIALRLINYFVYSKKLKCLTLNNVILTPELITSLKEFNGKLRVLRLGRLKICQSNIVIIPSDKDKQMKGSHMRLGKMTHVVNQLPSIDYTGIMSILNICGSGITTLALDPTLGEIPDELFDLVPNLVQFEAINTVFATSLQCENKYNKRLDLRSFIKTYKGILLSELLMIMMNTDQPMYVVNKNEYYLKDYRFCISGMTDRKTRSLLRKTLLKNDQDHQDLTVIFKCSDKLKFFTSQMLIYSNFLVKEGENIQMNCLNLDYIASISNEKWLKKEYLIDNNIQFHEYHFIRLSLISSPSLLTKECLELNILNEFDCDSDDDIKKKIVEKKIETNSVPFSTEKNAMKL